MPVESKQHVAALSVLVNGTEVPPEFRSMITEVRVRDSLSLPASAVVRLIDPRGEKVDDRLFDIGKELEIKTGALRASASTPIFKGEIVAFEPEFTKDGVYIVIRGYDKSHRLQRARKVRSFQDVTVTDIVQRLTREAGLAGSVRLSGGAVRYAFFLQSAETDREVIARLERDHDCRFYLENGRYVFSDAASGGGEPVTLKFTEGLVSFRPRVTGVQQVKTVEVRGWDPKAKQAIVNTASNGTTTSRIGVTRASVANTFGDAKVIVADRTVETFDQARAMAKSGLDRRADAFVEAEGVALGNPAIRAGKTVKIEGVGTKLGGTYVVTAATHTYRGEKGYATSFQISGRSERGLLDLMHPPEKREWGSNLVVGLVTNVNDPEKLGRVKVKFPSLSDQDESTWARVVTGAASNARGILMLPLVNDEVVVAFENGDTRRPLVIGSVFNGRDKPGEELLQGNDGSFAVASNEKGLIHTKKDLTFKSDQKMIIQVTSDREEKADGNVKQESGGSSQLKAGTSYEIEAGASIKIKGASISVEATGSLSLKGATVAIEAQSGPATLKGLTVDVQGTTMTNIKGALINLG